MYSIIIPQHHNDLQLTTCLDSIKASLKETDQPTSLEIIIVNNKATEFSKKLISQYQKNNPNLAIKPIFNKQNNGFAKAVNQGIKKAHGKYIVVLNNDIRLDIDWFNTINRNLRMFHDASFASRRASKSSNNQKVGTLFGKVLNDTGEKIESAGLKFKPWGKAINIGNDDSNIDKYNQQKIIWGAPASAVVYKKSALKEAGLFNPIFFAYLEDVEINLRLKAEGFETLYLPAAVSYHQGGKTADQWTDFRQKYTSRNWWYIFILHYPIAIFIKYLPLIIIEQTKIWLSIEKWTNRFWVIKQIISSAPKLLKQRKTIKI